MRYADESLVKRVLNNPHAVAERLAIWSEDARRAGRFSRADQLLLAAWEAFDLPSVSQILDSSPDAKANRREIRYSNWMDQAA